MNIIKKLKDQITENFIENPRYDLKIYDHLIRESFINFILAITIVIAFANFIIQLYYSYPDFRTIEALTLIGAVIIYVSSKFIKSHERIIALILAILSFVLIHSTLFQDNRNYDFVLILTFPLVAYNILGIKSGTSWTVLCILLCFLLFLGTSLEIISTTYSCESFIYIFATLIIISIIAYFSELRRHTIQELLIRKLYFDDTCSLGNRKMLMEDIDLSVSPALFILKIDNFNEINRFFGYHNGQIFISFLGERLKDFKSEYKSKLYSLSGGEFAILFNINDDKDRMFNIISQICEKLYEHFTSRDFPFGDNKIPLTSHIGASYYDSEKMNIVSKADIALHHATNLLIPFYIYHSHSKLDKYTGHLDILSELNFAIQNESIIPYFQPILTNKTNKIEKYECLMRIRDKDGIIQSPYKYLEVARKTRLHHELTKQMFLKTFEYIKDKDYSFALNISAYDIQSKNFTQMLRDIIIKFPENKNKIVLEIIESESIDKLTKISDFISEVKSLGYSIAIDDFGTGYSNFSNIFALQPDFIKFDGSLIKDIDKNNSNRIMIKNISKICRELKIQTIAEFIENEDVLNIIQSFDIDFSQGYFIGKPEAEIINT